MPKNRRVHAQAREAWNRAVAIMSEEYLREGRVKLTHFWLAEKLETERIVAFILLQKLAKRGIMCVQFPAGPIFWSDEKLPAGEVERLMVPKEKGA